MGFIGFQVFVAVIELNVAGCGGFVGRSEEHTSELQSQSNLVCRLLLEKKKKVFNFLHVNDKVVLCGSDLSVSCGRDSCTISTVVCAYNHSVASNRTIIVYPSVNALVH